MGIERIAENEPTSDLFALLLGQFRAVGIEKDADNAILIECDGYSSPSACSGCEGSTDTLEDAPSVSATPGMRAVVNSSCGS